MGERRLKVECRCAVLEEVLELVAVAVAVAALALALALP